MLRVNNPCDTDLMLETLREIAVRPNAVPRERACGVAAALIAVIFVGMSASAQAPASAASSVSAQHAVTKPAEPSSNNVKPEKKRFVSPYARAAGQRERTGQSLPGHAPTMVQGIGKAHKPHAGAPPK